MSIETLRENHRKSGFYGKLPSRGDYVSRDLASSFIEEWDEWIQRSVEVSKRNLGEQRWLECYIEGPLWRFALTKNTCGVESNVGVMMPSMDKVGRYFPLVVAHPVENDLVLLDLVANGDSWFQQIEKILLNVLDEELAPDDFARHLADLGLPEADLKSVKSPSKISAVYCPLNDLSQLQMALSRVGMFFLQGQDKSASLWWTTGSPHVLPSLLVCEGLPDIRKFSAFFSGEWSRWGWTEWSMT